MDNVEAIVEQVGKYTGLKRASLLSLWKLTSETALPEGSVVQCGVVNGGSAVLLWHAAGAGSRHLWMFDSWEGLPKPGAQDGGKAAAKYVHQIETVGSWCKGYEAEARKIARLSGIPDKQTHTVKGWFADTLPKWAALTAPIAVLHLDADWYKSTLECLEYLYPLLAPGGLLIFDDYGYWPGCDQACREYGIDELLTRTPPCGAWMIKK